MQKNIIQTLRHSPYKTIFIKRKARLLANTFINCQFLYAPLLWTFTSKSSINKICEINFRTLQIVYNAHETSYVELLAVSDDIFVHQKHLCFLVIQVYKSLMKANPDFMWDFYTIKPVRSSICLQLAQHIMV